MCFRSYPILDGLSVWCGEMGSHLSIAQQLSIVDLSDWECVRIHGISADAMNGDLPPIPAAFSAMVNSSSFKLGDFGFLTASGRRVSVTLQPTSESMQAFDNAIKLDFATVELELRSDEDGFIVAAAKGENVHLIGARLVAVDGTPIRRVLEMMEPLVGPVAKYGAGVVFLTSPAMLRTVGVDGDLGKITYTLTDKAGVERTVTLAAGRTLENYTYDTSAPVAPDGSTTNGFLMLPNSGIEIVYPLDVREPQ